MPQINTWNNYGGLYVEDNSTAEASSTSTPALLACFDTAMPTGSEATSSTSGNTITVTDAGDYSVSLQISFSGGSSDTYFVEIYVDGVGTDIKVERKLGTGGDTGSASLHGIVSVGAGEAISLYQSTDGTAAMTATNVQFLISGVN